MTRSQGQFAPLKIALRAGAAAIGLAAAGAVLLPFDATWAQAAPAPTDETSRYQLRMMLQRFDGARETSHTQVAGVARQRRGDESWTEVNFGHGSLVATSPGNVRAGSFTNTSGVEAGIRYDHATATLAGPAALAGFHNERVRPLLGGGPAPGVDADWTTTVTPVQLGFAGLGSQPITIALSRHYFRHEGRDYVLVHYRLPSFTYDLAGRTAVQWGEGVALTDPGFATVYWNASLHRAVAQEPNGSGRPYRYSRTAAAVDARGNPLVDPRRMAETASHFARFYGHANEEVMGYTERDGVADQQPLILAGQLDILALALAEGGGGTTARLAAAYLSDSRGNEAARPAPRPLVEAAAQRAAAAQPAASASQTSAPAVARGSGGDAMKRPDLRKGGGQTPTVGPPPSPTIGPPPQPTISGPPQPTIGGPPQPTIGPAPLPPPSPPPPPPPTGPSPTSAGGSGGQITVTMPDGTMPPPTGRPGEIDELNRLRAMFSAGVSWTNIAVGSEQEARIFMTLTSGLQSWKDQGERLRREYESVRAAYQRSMSELRNAPVQMPPAPGSRPAALQAEIDLRRANADRALQAFEASEMSDAPRAYRALQQAQSELEGAIRELERYTPQPGDYVARPVAGPMVNESARFAQREAQRLRQIEQQIAEHGVRGTQYASYIQEIPPTRFRAFINTLGSALGPLGIAMDGYTIGAAVANVANELERDPTTGNVNLTRQYGGDNWRFWVDLGADFLGLAGSALTGDVAGTFASAGAIATGSLTDIFLAARGLRATNRMLREMTEEQTRIARQERLAAEARSVKIMEIYAQMEQEIPEIREEIANLEQELRNSRAEGAEMARQLLEERRRNREEAARQAAAEAEAEGQRLIAEARAENERIYQENLRRPPTAAEWAKFNRDIEEAMRPDYPTAPPPTPEQVAARLAEAETRRRQEAAAEAQAIAEAAAAAAAEAAAELLARQEAEAEAQRVADEAVAAREAEAEERRRRNDEAEARELEVSSLDTDPVTFEPVNFEPPVWEPPVFEPPVWVPPEFDPPDPSEIPWTDFDDDNWLPSTDNLAYDYGDMAGVVETDLSRWAEWLATQNVRELTRLALQAGYPNLASALADAENIIRLSQDEGYRRWALQAPSCGGYVGCGPSYLERWAMKRSIVALGDILNQSRGIFSTGGFTDIGISGFNLAYLLRDNALQDGDIVQVTISQFGRVIYQGRINLTNAGDNFNLQLRPGVASLVILAENEGTASPNTAQVVVDNVVRGDGDQSYSLRTGETATLRIEANATGGD